MFREMRRKRQLLPQEECERILQNSTNGVLAVSGDDGYPYAVPISFVYADGAIFMHSALKGHKLDGIARSEKVSFCVVEKDEIHPDTFTTYFRSVIAFGRARIITDPDEKMQAVLKLAGKYSPGEPGLQHELDTQFKHMHMIRLEVEHLTGKEAIELVRARKTQES